MGSSTFMQPPKICFSRFAHQLPRHQFGQSSTNYKKGEIMKGYRPRPMLKEAFNRDIV